MLTFTYIYKKEEKKPYQFGDGLVLFQGYVYNFEFAFCLGKFARFSDQKNCEMIVGGGNKKYIKGASKATGRNEIR